LLTQLELDRLFQDQVTLQVAAVVECTKVVHKARVVMAAVETQEIRLAQQRLNSMELTDFTEVVVVVVVIALLQPTTTAATAAAA
jgi:hypothetical protein